jgi:hypothetical protein
MNTVGAKSSNASDVERIIGTDTLSLETILIAITVSSEVGVASTGQVDDGVADGVAFARDVIAVKTDVCASEQEKGSNGESDG